jgi:PhnB protein
MPKGKKSNSSSPTADRELIITRVLNAPIELVWEVWTNADHIKNWWGPNGFSNTISKMELKPGGEWNLVMHGPDGKDYKNKSVFKKIMKHKKIVYEHISGPKFTATIEFKSEKNKTHLKWHMLFETKEEFIQTVKTFKADEGLKQNISKLEAYISAQINIRKQLKTSSIARTSTYLNFNGNTEEAFLFYRSVFGGEFSGKGIQRFGEIPPHEGQPPLSEQDKKLILHIELQILGGHVLMGTDAPESLGFKLNFGNNSHICLEPESRKETKRLFEALAEDGTITMPLMDMFFGAYYGSCIDKFGVNWMVNCIAK